MLTGMSDMPDPTEVPTFDLPAWGTGGAPELDTDTEVEIVVEPVAPEPVVPEQVVVVTTETVPGRRITSGLGMVSGEAAVFVGERPVETAVREARATALDILRRHAGEVGAEAVVGVRADLAVRKSTVVVSVVGTAVTLG